MRIAVLVDAAFFISRYRKLFSDGASHSGDLVADALHRLACEHLRYENAHETVGGSVADLYRVFVYDCPPFNGKIQHPVSKATIDYSKSETAVFRKEFHHRLKQMRKVALRLGHLSDVRGWMYTVDAMEALIKGKRTLESIQAHEVRLDTKQKGVDMRVGVDVASLAFKRQVDRIVLIAGDADFVPAAKLARREGVDFVLDSMHAKIGDDLYEHIDGLHSTAPKAHGDPQGVQPAKTFAISPTPIPYLNQQGVALPLQHMGSILEVGPNAKVTKKINAKSGTSKALINREAGNDGDAK